MYVCNCNGIKEEDIKENILETLHELNLKIQCGKCIKEYFQKEEEND